MSEPKIITHGIDCQKVPHIASVAYLHASLDDEPYDVDGVSYCGRCHYALDIPETSHTEPRDQALRAMFTNEVIRAIGALARQQNVCREQDGQAVFVTGMEAAREYIVEHVRLAFGQPSIGAKTS